MLQQKLFAASNLPEARGSHQRRLPFAVSGGLDVGRPAFSSTSSTSADPDLRRQQTSASRRNHSTRRTSAAGPDQRARSDQHHRDAQPQCSAVRAHLRLLVRTSAPACSRRSTAAARFRRVPSRAKQATQTSADDDGSDDSARMRAHRKRDAEQNSADENPCLHRDQTSEEQSRAVSEPSASAIPRSIQHRQQQDSRCGVSLPRNADADRPSRAPYPCPSTTDGNGSLLCRSLLLMFAAKENDRVIEQRPVARPLIDARRLTNFENSIV